jgi:HAD superfamily hydrolase (TIGR01549 family)
VTDLTPRAGAVEPIEAVTFDLGDTLWHFPQRPPEEAVHAELAGRTHHLLRAWGMSPASPIDDLQHRLTRARLEVQRTADARGGDGGGTADYLAAIEVELTAAGLDLAPWQLAQVWQAQDIGGAFLGREVFDDAVPVLRWLRERGVRIGALTNRSHGGGAFLEELRAYGLLEHFDCVISSDQVGYRKPHPRIFERTLEALEVSDAARCVHVGDRLDADVAGARRAGMIAVWMRPPRASAAVPSDGDEPHHTVTQVSDLMAWPIVTDVESRPRAGGSSSRPADAKNRPDTPPPAR